MRRRIVIDVRDRAELEAIKASLADPVFRAMAVVNGILLPMSGPHRAFVLTAAEAWIDMQRQSGAGDTA